MSEKPQTSKAIDQVKSLESEIFCILRGVRECTDLILLGFAAYMLAMMAGLEKSNLKLALIAICATWFREKYLKNLGRRPALNPSEVKGVIDK